MRRLAIVLTLMIPILGAAPAMADHTGGGEHCDVPTNGSAPDPGHYLRYSTADGAQVLACYPDGRAGAGTHQDGRTYVYWDPSYMTPAKGYAILWISGTSAKVCSVGGGYTPGQPPPPPKQGSSSCYP
ncbi:MAG TPA: hypothetical protein VM840_03425 [Actinomycetota bacterium]|nr:hypothetical protein [Actinomycetota bacterium]